MNEEEYTKVLNVIDQVLTQVEEQLKEQPEGRFLLYYVIILHINNTRVIDTKLSAPTVCLHGCYKG